MTTGQAMDMPDGAGWWAFEGYINYAKGANPNETMREVVRVFWGKTTQAWQTVSINGRHPAYMLIGKWHKFAPPWESQPPPTPALSPQSVRVMREALRESHAKLQRLKNPDKYLADRIAIIDAALAELDALAQGEV